MKQSRRLYEEPWLAEIYDTAYQGPGKPQEDLAFWRDLAGESEGPLLELACGTGRLAIPLAREGFQVTGLDISPAMLAVARRKLGLESPEIRARLELVEGDMSNFSLGKKYGLIIIAYRSFQHLLERASQRQCLAGCAAHLQPGGRLAINVFHPKLSLLAVPGPAEIPVHEHVTPAGARVRESGFGECDIANQKVRWRPRYECISPEGKVTLRESYLELRYCFRFEMEWMLEACGFEVEALYGNFDHSPLQADSPEMIFVAKKR
jgi:ubiquinone/menaquinone biosynthesis C-methylase UbiE